MGGGLLILLSAADAEKEARKRREAEERREVEKYGLTNEDIFATRRLVNNDSLKKDFKIRDLARTLKEFKKDDDIILFVTGKNWNSIPPEKPIIEYENNSKDPEKNCKSGEIITKALIEAKRPDLLRKILLKEDQYEHRIPSGKWWKKDSRCHLFDTVVSHSNYFWTKEGADQLKATFGNDKDFFELAFKNSQIIAQAIRNLNHNSFKNLFDVYKDCPNALKAISEFKKTVRIPFTGGKAPDFLLGADVYSKAINVVEKDKNGNVLPESKKALVEFINKTEGMFNFTEQHVAALKKIGIDSREVGVPEEKKIEEKKDSIPFTVHDIRKAMKGDQVQKPSGRNLGGDE